MATKSFFANPRLAAVVLAASVLASGTGCAVNAGAVPADANGAAGPQEAAQVATTGGAKDGSAALNPKAVQAQAPTAAQTEGGFSFEGFILALAEGLLGDGGGLNITIGGVDYDRIDSMIKDDLKHFGETEDVEHAANDIVAKAKDLKKIADGRAADPKGSPEQAITQLNAMWKDLDADLSNISTQEHMRRPGFKTYLLGASVEHAVYQELVLIDPDNANDYRMQLRDTLEDHVDYVSSQLVLIDKDHTERLAKVGQCEGYSGVFSDVNHAWYYDQGTKGGDDVYTPKASEHEGQTDWANDATQGQAHYYGVLKGYGDDQYMSVWTVYNTKVSGTRRCPIARENYLRDMNEKMQQLEPATDAHVALSKWQTAYQGLGGK